MLSFKPTFSLSSFTFIKRLFSSSSLSAIRVVSSAYLRLLLFLPAILIPACVSSSPAYSFSYLEPICCSMSSSNCCFLTCIQISHEAGQVVWHSHLFQNFPQFIVIHRVNAEYVHAIYAMYMQNTSWETLGWKKHKLESRLLGEIAVTSDMQLTPSLWKKVKRN